MEDYELRDPETARRFLAEGLCLRLSRRPGDSSDAENTKIERALDWAAEIASAGHPLPPIAFIADVGQILLTPEILFDERELPAVPGWPPALRRGYADNVVSKLYTDPTIERAGDAIRRYDPVRELNKGVAYVVNQICERNRLSGVMIPPAAIRSLKERQPHIIDQGWNILMREGPLPLQIELFQKLISAFRHAPDLLGREDVEALEDRSAIFDMGQYIALRQIRQVSSLFEKDLPDRWVRPFSRRREIPTRILDENSYPVGGYSSISNRGTPESLLQSQLAYIEEDESPDLFDVKYVREELFYYARDENQFLRNRRTFVFVLMPDLTTARFQDLGLTYQRIVLIQALIFTVIRRLIDCLSTDALHFEILYVLNGNKNVLADEMSLMQLLLRVEIQRGDCVIRTVASDAQVWETISKHSQRSQVHVLMVSTQRINLSNEQLLLLRNGWVMCNQLVVNGPIPEITDDDSRIDSLKEDEPFKVWSLTTRRLVELWV